MASHAGGPAENIRLEPDAWAARLKPDSRLKLDPGLRYALALIESRKWDHVFRRTGLQSTELQEKLPKDLQRKWDKEKAEYLTLLVEFNWATEDKVGEGAQEWLSEVGLVVAEGYFHDGPPKYAAARIKVDAKEPYNLYPGEGELGTAEKQSLRDRIDKILSNRRVVRLELPSAAQAMNEDALADVGLIPASERNFKGIALEGDGVIVGIIDDGCALAHPNFLDKGSGGPPTSRILYLWDPAHEPAGHWASAGNFGGRELKKQVLDIVLAKHFKNGVVVEDGVYDELDYRLDELASHGTRVMDIAAGNGNAPMSTEGVAPKADIIFVQLPRVTVESGGVSLDAAILEGVRYIFDRAAGKPAVVNISYGGYRGPHDGSSIIEQAIDAELASAKNRAVVVAAGNGFEADCHACGEVKQGAPKTLRWIVKPKDPTENILEVWYEDKAELTVTLVTPAKTTLGPVDLSAGPQNLQVGNVVLGMLDHQSCASQKLNRITITLNPTSSADGDMDSAPTGEWKVKLTHKQGSPANFDAWIERDVMGRAGGARRLQSHFHPNDAKATGTLASYATGKRSLAVGAYNTATQQLCRYSACGPTRGKPGRQKPEVLAPAEEDAAGRGILCASSRSALPGRMNGTSAAAPQVAGLIALLLQAAQRKGKSLTVAKIRSLVCDGAKHGTRRPKLLRPNGHNMANPRRKVKQNDSAIWGQLIGDGRVDWPESRKRV